MIKRMKEAVETEPFLQKKLTAAWNAVRSLAAGPSKITRPDFYHWSFGHRPYLSSLEAQSTEFRFWFTPTVPRKPYSFREEVFRACSQLDRSRGKSTIALCYSGGIDSEMLALALAEMGLPFELYFLDIWGKNRAPFAEWSGALESKIGKKTNVIQLGRGHFYEEHSLRIFQEFGCELPTYLAMTYLFEQIPRDQFILVGDGDLHRSGGLFAKLAKTHPLQEGATGLHLPFSYSSVFYHLWAKSFRRKGEFYFFSSTPELLAAAAMDPNFRYRFPNGDTREVIYAAFPEIRRREKSTNWDGESYRENTWIRVWIESNARKNEKMRFWQKGIGTLVRLDDIFLPS